MSSFEHINFIFIPFHFDGKIFAIFRMATICVNYEENSYGLSQTIGYLQCAGCIAFYCIPTCEMLEESDSV